jgi:hypothetical protein
MVNFEVGANGLENDFVFVVEGGIGDFVASGSCKVRVNQNLLPLPYVLSTPIRPPINDTKFLPKPKINTGRITQQFRITYHKTQASSPKIASN